MIAYFINESLNETMTDALLKHPNIAKEARPFLTYPRSVQVTDKYDCDLDAFPEGLNPFVFYGKSHVVVYPSVLLMTRDDDNQNKIGAILWVCPETDYNDKEAKYLCYYFDFSIPENAVKFAGKFVSLMVHANFNTKERYEEAVRRLVGSQKYLDGRLIRDVHYGSPLDKQGSFYMGRDSMLSVVQGKSREANKMNAVKQGMRNLMK